MKKLYLLRHAESPSAAATPDIERHLSPAGLAQAHALGRTLKLRAARFDLVFCSPATRTRETLSSVLESLAAPNIRYERIIYEGMPGDVLSLIQSAPDEAGSLLVVGHNPTIHALAAMLAMEKDPAPMSRLSMGYAPATLSILECPVARWAEIQPGANPLLDCMRTVDYQSE